MRWRVLFFALLVSAGTSLPAWAVELTPFAVRNFSPLALIHGLPVAESARLNPAGQFSAHLGFDIANNSSMSSADGEEVLLDGESYVTTLGLRYGITDRLQVGIDLPWIAHDQGSMDGFIEDWHDFFGLPNGDRNKLPKNELTYAYANDRGDHLLLDEDTSGLGDIRLLAAWQLLANDQSAASLVAAIKAPTGDADDLTGSGAWDISLALSGQRDFPLEQGRIGLWGGVGGTWLGSGDVLNDLVEEWAASAWLGAGWAPLSWLGLKLQLDSHSALYDSELDELGNAAVILTMGGTISFSDSTALDIGVGEDLAVSASPDVTFHLDLSHRF